jgi:predicted RecA/RadA family phage recombinase
MAVVDAFTHIFGSFDAAGNVVAQNIFSAGAAVVSGSSIDTTGATKQLQAADLGEGQPLYLNVTFINAVVGGTGVDVQVISADDAALTTNVTVLAASGPIATAALKAGSKVSVPIGKYDPRALRRYVGGQVVSAGTTTAGSINGGIGPFTGDRSKQQNYQSGYAIL